MQKDSIEEQKIQQAINNILRGEDIKSAAYILKKFMFDNVIFIGRRVNPVKIATRQVLNFIERYQASDYETICLENNEMEEIVDKIQVEYNNLLKENEYMHKQLDKQQTTINKYAKENEELENITDRMIDYIMIHQQVKTMREIFCKHCKLQNSCTYSGIHRNCVIRYFEYISKQGNISKMHEELEKILESEE